MNGLLLVVVLLIVAAALIESVVYILIPLYLRLVRRELTRTDRVAAVAARFDLAFSRQDPTFPGSTASRYPFELLSRGERQSCENVMRGTVAGKAVIAFDLLYRYDGDSEPVRYSCVIVEIDGSVPHLLIEPASPMPQTPAEHDGGRVELEWSDFNARYRVYTPERGFAPALLDLDVMAWLVDDAPRIPIVWEVQRGFVLGRVRDLEAEDFRELVAAGIELARRIPQAAGSAP